jgi:CRP-like cAMP-binding protein
MHGGLGPTPKPAKVKAGTTIIAEGDAADDIVLLLDGLVQVEANGTELARLGPGSVLGERASVEQSHRTATVRAVTDCRVVSYLAADLPVRDLRELAAGHYREGR